jgi:transposase-like protein
VRTNGRDRRGTQVFDCKGCRRSFTHRSGTPFARYRVPPDVIALAVRYYLRYRLTYADLAEWLAERGVHVDRSTLYDWVQHFTPLFQEAARPHRQRVGRVWSVDETYLRVGKHWPYAYRAIDEHGQVIDVYVSPHRAAEDAKAFFTRSIISTGVRPRRVTTDKAGCYLPALAEVLPEAEHVTGKREQQRLERDHQHMKGRLRPMRNFKTELTAQVICAGHGFVRNLAGGFYRLGLLVGDRAVPQPPLMLRTWDELTELLLAG